jgi:hypothetical protein
MHDQLTRGNGHPTAQGAPGSLAMEVPPGAGEAAATRERAGGPFAAGEVTEITHITTKSDLARWTRVHEGSPGITWSVFPATAGPWSSSSTRRATARRRRRRGACPGSRSRWGGCPVSEQDLEEQGTPPDPARMLAMSVLAQTAGDLAGEGAGR